MATGNATDTDRWIRGGTAAAVLFVAAIAAVVSFIHIQTLALTHGQTWLASVLLPFSIDGTVVAASLVLLRAARAQIRAPWLAQVMLWSAVAATLAANIGYGWSWGVPGALLSGWPAYAFIGCAEMAILMVRRTARTTARRVPERPPLPSHRQVRDDHAAGPETAKKIRTALQARDRTWLASFNGNSHE